MDIRKGGQYNGNGGGVIMEESGEGARYLPGLEKGRSKEMKGVEDK